MGGASVIRISLLTLTVGHRTKGSIEWSVAHCVPGSFSRGVGSIEEEIEDVWRRTEKRCADVASSSEEHSGLLVMLRKIIKSSSASTTKMNYGRESRQRETRCTRIANGAKPHRSSAPGQFRLCRFRGP